MNDTENINQSKSHRKQTAQQKLNNFLRSSERISYRLSYGSIAVLHALASYFYYNLECNPSYKSILLYTGLKDDETLSTYIAELEGYHLITVIRKKGCSNKYTWFIPEVSDEEIYKKKSVNKKGKTCED